MQALAEARGGKCLSSEYLGGSTKLRWQCQCGEEWNATPAYTKAGKWCPKCSNGGPLRKRKYEKAFELLKQIAKNFGGECLSETYVNATTKLLWRCAEGHEWWDYPKRIRKGRWCPECRGWYKTITDMQLIASSRNGKCLSKKYTNAHTKLRWQCAKGHEWEASPHRVVRGTWCPYCRGLHRTIRDMQDLAKSRGGKCLSKNFNKMVDELFWQCKHGHTWIATAAAVNGGSWCPYCAGLHKSIADMQELASRKGGQCLSKTYVNSQEKLLWRCAEGHQWEATPGNIGKGRWCPFCAGKYWSLKGMQRLAQTKGGQCLSEEYDNAWTELRWQCHCGHQWRATPRQVACGGWCPKCRKEHARAS